jgi:hypothetical protein
MANQLLLFSAPIIYTLHPHRVGSIAACLFLQGCSHAVTNNVIMFLHLRFVHRIRSDSGDWRVRRKYSMLVYILHQWGTFKFKSVSVSGSLYTRESLTSVQTSWDVHSTNRSSNSPPVSRLFTPAVPRVHVYNYVTCMEGCGCRSLKPS